MKVKCVSSYDEIKRVISELTYQTDNNILFRGTPNPLVSSLVEKFPNIGYPDLVVKEHLLFEDFTKYSHIKYKSHNPNLLDWEIRISAREYGLASSLFDWSNSIDTALEFAIHKFEQKKLEHTSLWILLTTNIPHFILNETDTPDLKFQDVQQFSIISYPVYTDETFYHRKFIQGGYFLKLPYHNITTHLNLNPEISDNLIQIVIPRTVVMEIWKTIASKFNLDQDICINLNSSDKALCEICEGLNKRYL